MPDQIFRTVFNLFAVTVALDVVIASYFSYIMRVLICSVIGSIKLYIMNVT